MRVYLVDSHCTQSSCSDRSTHHGRLRPRRSNPLLPPFRTLLCHTPPRRLALELQADHSKQSGKVHFGYIYGLALLGSTSLHAILSLMSPPLDPSISAASHSVPPPGTALGSSHFSSTLTLSRSASVLGYCLLPLVLTSLIGIAVPMDTLVGYVLTSLAIVWCTFSSSAMFCAVGRMSGMKGLVAYPLGLFYVGFGIMGIFSSRGTGTLAVVAKTGVA